MRAVLVLDPSLCCLPPDISEVVDRNFTEGHFEFVELVLFTLSIEGSDVDFYEYMNSIGIKGDDYKKLYAGYTLLVTRLAYRVTPVLSRMTIWEFKFGNPIILEVDYDAVNGHVSDRSWQYIYLGSGISNLFT